MSQLSFLFTQSSQGYKESIWVGLEFPEEPGYLFPHPCSREMVDFRVTICFLFFWKKIFLTLQTFISTPTLGNNSVRMLTMWHWFLDVCLYWPKKYGPKKFGKWVQSLNEEFHTLFSASEILTCPCPLSLGVVKQRRHGCYAEEEETRGRREKKESQSDLHVWGARQTFYLRCNFLIVFLWIALFNNWSPFIGY